MTERPDDPSKPTSRDERLRAALRANLQRRKAQARARAADEGDGPQDDGPQENGPQDSDTGKDDS